MGHHAGIELCRFYWLFDWLSPGVEPSKAIRKGGDVTEAFMA